MRAWCGFLRETGAALAPLGRASVEGATAERRLLEFYGVATLEGFGPLTRAEINAASGAIAYIERTQFASRPRLSRPNRSQNSECMEIDAATRGSLELIRTLTGQRAGSLISVVDRTTTPAGARTMADWLAAPLRDREKIAARQDVVGFFSEDPLIRSDLRQRLKGVPDMMRALGRLALDRGGPRDLAALRDGLLAARDCGLKLQAKAPPYLLAEAAEYLAGVDLVLPQELSVALADDLPLGRRDGHFIRSSYEDALMTHVNCVMKAVKSSPPCKVDILSWPRPVNSRSSIIISWAIYRGFSGARGKAAPPSLQSDFIHRQTMADAMRFSTTELAELEGKITNAADQALALEQGLFDHWRRRRKSARPKSRRRRGRSPPSTS